MTDFIDNTPPPLTLMTQPPCPTSSHGQHYQQEYD